MAESSDESLLVHGVGDDFEATVVGHNFVESQQFRGVGVGVSRRGFQAVTLERLHLNLDIILARLGRGRGRDGVA
jgi:hypothetical protein